MDRPECNRTRLSRERHGGSTNGVSPDPEDIKFFDLFIADGENLAAAADRLAELVDRYDRLDERIAEIQALEKRGDEIDREINARLEDAFVTPFDREDIHELAVRVTTSSTASRWLPKPS